MKRVDVVIKIDERIADVRRGVEIDVYRIEIRIVVGVLIRIGIFIAQKPENSRSARQYNDRSQNRQENYHRGI